MVTPALGDVLFKPFSATNSRLGSLQIIGEGMHYRQLSASWEIGRGVPVSVNPNGVDYDLICGCYHDTDPICFMRDG